MPLTEMAREKQTKLALLLGINDRLFTPSMEDWDKEFIQLALENSAIYGNEQNYFNYRGEMHQPLVTKIQVTRTSRGRREPANILDPRMVEAFRPLLQDKKELEREKLLVHSFLCYVFSLTASPDDIAKIFPDAFMTLIQGESEINQAISGPSQLTDDQVQDIHEQYEGVLQVIKIRLVRALMRM